jgi:hypothetical protein
VVDVSSSTRSVRLHAIRYFMSLTAIVSGWLQASCRELLIDVAHLHPASNLFATRPSGGEITRQFCVLWHKQCEICRVGVGELAKPEVAEPVFPAVDFQIDRP